MDRRAAVFSARSYGLYGLHAPLPRALHTTARNVALLHHGTSRYRHGDLRRPPWRETADGRSYISPEFGCCSWQEGQRAMRSLWRSRLAESLAQRTAECSVTLSLFLFADS